MDCLRVERFILLRYCILRKRMHVFFTLVHLEDIIGLSFIMISMLYPVIYETGTQGP
jgi:hypothetical protein